MEKAGFAGKDQDGLFGGLSEEVFLTMKREVLKCEDA